MDNKLLAKVPADEMKLVQLHLHEVPLQYMQVLSEPDEPITQIYFPTGGVLSMVNEPDSGDIIEFATIGNEGMVGVPVLLGSTSMPSRVLVQVAGSAFRIEARKSPELLKQTPVFQARLMRYVMALLNQVAQATSCNRLHEVQERCARWLLHTHDRVWRQLHADARVLKPDARSASPHRYDCRTHAPAGRIDPLHARSNRGHRSGRFGSGGLLLLSRDNGSLRELDGRDLNCRTETPPTSSTANRRDRSNHNGGASLLCRRPA